MQVRLIIADELHKGRTIPVELPTFVIGRADGCNLRLRDMAVSRCHCAIQVGDGVVVVQDLGGSNGTFVNGSRVTNVQSLRDGDQLVVGTHTLMVSIQPKAEQTGATVNGDHAEGFYELPSSAALEQREETEISSAGMATAILQVPNPTEPDPQNGIMFDVRLDGQKVSVTKERLFELARKGLVLPDDLVTVAGTKVFADSIQGMVFGDKASEPALSPAPPPGVLRQEKPRQNRETAAAEADPFNFSDFGGTADAAGFFQTEATVPIVRIARNESTSKAIWNALDITFSRVYTMEGNNLVIHSLKALYYIVGIACALGIFLFWLDVGVKCSNAENALAVFYSYAFALSVVTIGCITIIVIVRVLLEMLLLTWIESARQEEQARKDRK